VEGIESALQEDLEVMRLNAREYAQKYLMKNTIISDFERNLLTSA
jgi:colanic acid biosynthesis glycosyl transferase WcaI